MPASPVPSPATAWWDEGAVDPQWGPPGPPSRTLSPAAVVLAVSLVLVLLLGLVWRLGGFEARTDVVADAAVGSTLDTGPYQLRFTEATAQQRTDFQNRVTWRVTMVGEGLTTGDESITPDYDGDDGMFVAKDPAGGEVQTPSSVSFRPGSSLFGGSFTPGLPLQPFSVTFDFSEGYRPPATVTFLVYDVELRDTSLLGNQDPEWANTAYASRLRLPLRVLAPVTS
ncbi:hypothetical protein [uncultured Friedmanniella sp.]|uniref:hypothetical protein n=1 Tax=uncultured Friedmanniella sp. TaxID=335381 RepID=UPI0035CC4734